METINPSGLVPSLEIRGLLEEPVIITQSLAMIEFLENFYPNRRSLIPADPLKRAFAYELALNIACDVHPLQNLRVIKEKPEELRSEYARNVIENGLSAFESRLEKIKNMYPGNFCLGDEITIADIVLVPQYYNANRWECDLTKFPKIAEVISKLLVLEEFILAHPDQQPDCPTRAKI